MTGHQQERRYAYKEADRHGGVYEGYLGGGDDQGKHPVAVLSIKGELPLILLGLAWQVGAVDSGTNTTG